MKRETDRRQIDADAQTGRIIEVMTVEDPKVAVVALCQVILYVAKLTNKAEFILETAAKWFRRKAG